MRDVAGQVVRGDNDEEPLARAQAHIDRDHPELVGRVSRDDLPATAEEV
ncbi:MAG: hypothetical protein ACM33B_04070 [Pseudomonadota bacterium]